ncbi:MAG: phage minor capsid protein [Anaerorhabdus sp.]
MAQAKVYVAGTVDRHSFYPYFEGLSSVSARRYSMQENERIYNLTQKQRYNERMIRKWKREQVVLDAGGLDSSLAARKVKGWKKFNDALIKSNSDVLKHDYFRESIIKPNYLSSGSAPYGKSTFKQVGKLTNLDSEIKIKVLKAYEKQIVSSSIENAIVILANGDIFKVVGSGSTVDPTIVGDLTNAFITHNHPIAETEYSFSDLDASLFSTKNIDVLRGIDSLFTYQMSKIDLFIDDITKSMNEMSEYDFRHYKMIQRAKKFNFGYWRKNNER